MKILEKNIKNVWGKIGQRWLNQLPSIIERLSDYWSLTNIKPVDNMSYNYVALATQKDNIPVVLKISCDEQLIANEYKALKHFDGHGSVKVLDINKAHNALLLEQAIPGYLLKGHHPIKIENTIKIYAQVVKALSSPSLTTNNYTHVSQWCQALDRIEVGKIDKHFVKKAKELRSFLLNSAKQEYLCHGDLHLENIIQHGKKWLAIDPKGIIGEMAFEVAAFDLISKDELKDTATIQEKIVTSATLLSRALDLCYERLLAWMFLRAILAAQWFLEDNGDPSEMLTLATLLFKANISFSP